MIRLCNEVRADALSLECPSGLEPDTGEPLAPTLKARTTLALGLPATGLFASLAWQFTGELWLCDIGYPPEALEAADLDGEGLFAANELVRPLHGLLGKNDPRVAARAQPQRRVLGVGIVRGLRAAALLLLAPAGLALS